MTDDPKEPPHYVLLNPGDVIQERDEFYRDNQWQPTVLRLRRAGDNGCLYRRRVDLARPEPAAPYHTDLMVSPETIDAFMVANPLVEDAQYAIEQALQTCDAWAEHFFSPISKEELRKAVDAVIASGISSDRLHASWARHVVGLLKPALTQSVALFVQLRDDLDTTQRELAKAHAAIDANWVTHQRIVKAEDDLATLRAANDKLSAQIGRMREALKWYANPDIYARSVHGIAFDNGDLSYHAHAALATDADHE